MTVAFSTSERPAPLGGARRILTDDRTSIEGNALKLVTYEGTDGEPRAGLLLDDDVVVDAEACAAEGALDPSIRWASVKAIIGAASQADREALHAAAARLAPTAGMSRAEVTLRAPVPDPEKVLCIGLNYRDHVEEAQQINETLGTQADPVVFSKFAGALVGDGGDIVIPTAAPGMIDWEGELAVVIGRTCRRVVADDALDHVAGYTVLNDVSARDVQLASPQWLMGKSFDTSGPCGPALVTADEITDPQDLTLTTTVNGKEVQRTTTALMINPISRLIEYISSLITLVPGDIIATGTPAGVGYSRKPQVFLQPGDTVTVTVEHVGALTNPVRAEG